MSGPKRPRPKLCFHFTDVSLLKGLDEMRSFHFEGMRGVFKLKIQQLHIVISASIKYTDQTAQFARAGLYNGNRPQIEALLDYEKLKM